MDKSTLNKLFGQNPATSQTIFHEIVEAGAIQLLYRIRDNVRQPLEHFLRATNNGGDHCIHVVVKKHRGEKAIQFLKVLVELGADLNAVNTFTHSAVLHIAVVSGDYKLVVWLANQPNIDLDVIGWDGLTAYDMAYIERSERMMDILIAYGARGPAPAVAHDWSVFVNRDE